MQRFVHSLRPFVLALCVSSLQPSTPLPGQTDSATVPNAIAAMQAGNFDRAVELLGVVTTREPENAQAWLMLGTARRSAGDLRGALDAQLAAVEFSAVAPRAMYNVGITYAMMNEPDHAFAWLTRAKATGRFNMTQIGVDPNAASLQSDARYASLFPSADEYADPFVERVAILQEWVGEAAGDQFGWVARNIGDVDGDGINDVVTSAPTNAAGGNLAGKVYVYSGGTGALLWEHVGDSAAQLGTGIEAAGDVNGDGVPDVIAGAPGISKAYVFSGNTGHTLLTLVGDETTESLGQDVNDLGDVDGDGHDDVMVGAPANGAAGQNSGAAYVFSGRDGRRLLTLRGAQAGDRFGSAIGGGTRGGSTLLVVGAGSAGPNRGGQTYVYEGLTDRPKFIIEADETGGSLGGMFVSVVGDVDGDQVADVYASDWANGAKGNSTGRIYVHSGASGERLLTLTGEAAGDGFGIGPADAGDVNGDGHDDLIVGAWQHASAAPSGGKTYLFSGKDGALLHAYTGKVPGETFGFDATGMGDVDGDGTIDFLLTSAWSAIRGPRSGRLFIVSGRIGNQS